MNHPRGNVVISFYPSPDFFFVLKNSLLPIRNGPFWAKTKEIHSRYTRWVKTKEYAGSKRRRRLARLSPSCPSRRQPREPPRPYLRCRTAPSLTFHLPPPVGWRSAGSGPDLKVCCAALRPLPALGLPQAVNAQLPRMEPALEVAPCTCSPIGLSKPPTDPSPPRPCSSPASRKDVSARRQCAEC